MNKKEISEIKKQFTPANCAITRICGCYVDGEKNKVTEFKEAFLSLPEEEIFKYFEIFRKVLSGTLGKNLLNMEFPLNTEMEGGTQEFLLQLRDSQLKEDDLLEQYYDKVIDSYTYGENYLILLIHAAYDIPGKASDNLEMFDASDEVYSYIISCICPVNLAKPALSYNAQDRCFQNRIRDWVVELPQLGFLFPAFNDRSTDLHSLLYYSKNPEELHFEFTDSLLGCSLPLSAESQKEAFQTLIEETLGDSCDYEVVKNIHENLHEMTEEKKDSPDPVVLSQAEVKNLLSISGVENEKLENFDRHFEDTAGANASFMASNIMNTRKFEVKTPDITIQVSPDRPDLVETRIIDGRPCLVIPITDQVQVNGITVKNDPSASDDVLH
ncbi:MAG: DUF4317 domain-containing protein [Lachnospiraceae bacterium]|nr:DUF4317 domain-containing protein [Lachnospiraceae bacterium]